MSRGEKKPLYRKVNTQARFRQCHRDGGNYRDDRQHEDGVPPTMARGVRRGLDYTPLYRFLHSRVGHDWDEVYSEAVSRLDRPDPIFRLVALRKEDGRPIVCIGETTYFSGLYVDEDNRLRAVAPDVGAESLNPCHCCTYTLNGIRVPFRGR